MNEEIVAALERERLRGMPRWNLCPAWLDEAQRRLRAENNTGVIRLLSLDESGPRSASTLDEGLTATDFLGVA